MKDFTFKSFFISTCVALFLFMCYNAQSLAEDNGEHMFKIVPQKEFTIYFDANGGLIPVDGNMGITPSGRKSYLNPDRTAGYVVTVKNTRYFYGMESDTPSRDGYSFEGWFTKRDGGVQVYDSKGICVPGEFWSIDRIWVGVRNVQLYAHWSPSQDRTFEGIIECGAFTVSPTKQVNFSKGMLQYNAMADTHMCADGTIQQGVWRFAENQWDYVGNAEEGTVYENGVKCNNELISSTYNGWIDLFGWGTSGWNSGANAYQPYSVSQNSEDYFPGGNHENNLTGDYAYADWGVYNAISNGGDKPEQWRTLTADEWDYLFNERPDADKLYGEATVNGVKGYVLFPDGYLSPSNQWIRELTSFVPTPNEWTTNEYDAQTWLRIEEIAGAVFLPRGMRRNLGEVEEDGGHWSSSAANNHNSAAQGVALNGGKPVVNNGSRPVGHIVRLVKNCKENTIYFDANGGLIPENGNMGSTPSGRKSSLNPDRTAGYVVVLHGTPYFCRMEDDIPLREGYSFGGWFTEPDGGVQVYNSAGLSVPGEYWNLNMTWAGGEDVHLYAHWSSYQNPEEKNALKGVFSVEDGRKVHFSPGNLQYNVMAGTHICADGSVQNGVWRFAENQWDYVGEDNLNASESYNGWIDMFLWGCNGWNGTGSAIYEPFYQALHPSEYKEFEGFSGPLKGKYINSDWGVYNSILNGGNQPNQWRCPSIEEWNYLFYQRHNADALYAAGCVNGVNGLILLPDDWVCPDNITIIKTIVDYTHNVFTIAQWKILEENGAVFLPAAGFLGSKGYHNNNSGCWYVSSDTIMPKEYNFVTQELVWFSENSLDLTGIHHLGSRRTVRLISDVKSYNVKFINYDGTELQSEELEYGSLPEYKGNVPTKPSDDQYSYTFIGWDQDITEVTFDKTYTAQYSSKINDYKVADICGNVYRFIKIGTQYWMAENMRCNKYDSQSENAGAVLSTTTSKTFAPYYIDASVMENWESTQYSENLSEEQIEKLGYLYNWAAAVGFASESEAQDQTSSFVDNRQGICPNGWHLPTDDEWINLQNYIEVVEEKGDNTAGKHLKTTSGWYDEYDNGFDTYSFAALPAGSSGGSQVSNVGYSACFWTATPQSRTSASVRAPYDGLSLGYSGKQLGQSVRCVKNVSASGFVVKFLNYDGTELQSEELDYGTFPEYKGDTPIKPADAEFTYTFSGWNPEVVAVVRDQTYTAQFSSFVNKYIVRFLNDDGTELQRSELAYGAVPVYTGETPTKASTAQYYYTFSGWNNAIVPVEKSVDYTATYASTVNKYTVVFVNYDGSELQSGELEYGQTPAYTGTTPEKPADAEFTYTFSGWSPEVVSVVGAQTYTAQFSSTVNKYVIRFLNEDGTELQSEELEYGTIPVYSGETPTKDATAQYTYTFSGWDTEIGKVTGAKDYTATYSSITNKYLITFENYNGTELQSSEVEYGQMPDYTGATPSKPADAEFTYTFSGWSPEVATVVGTQTYTAQFSSTVNKYVVRFLNEDGAELQSEELDYGTVPVYKGETPTKDATAQYTYTFNGWDSEIGKVTGAKDYTATYSGIVNKYLITFENYNGDELQSSEVEYGQMPSYTGNTPEKPADAEFTYTFSGWSPEVATVVGTQTYTAQFSSTVNKYVVRFLNEDGTELQSEELEYGTIPVYTGEIPIKDATAQYTYTFAGWDSEIGEVTRSKDYTATYSSALNKYLINFENYDGTELQSKEVSYGDTPVYTGATPEKPADAEFTYTFSDWSPEVVSVVGAQTYTAQFSSTVNKYVVRFLNEDGTELQSEELEYGAIPVYAGETPTKDATAQYTYTFNGWDSEIGKVTGAKDYTATYTSTVNKYLITFENYDGDELQSSEVEYGQIPSYAGNTPEKPADAEFTYTFSDWSPEVVPVVGAQTYTAQFSSTVNKYVVRFLNEDGTELQNEELEYGYIPVYAGETPTKQSTAQYTYTFNGWNSEIEKVTGAKDYTATYTSTVNKYIITFENYNGDELQSGEVEYGQIPSYTGATPEKPADAEFTYTFSGWSPEVVSVVGAQTYTAQFSSTVNKYVVRFLNEDGTELQNEELEYGAIPVYAGETPTKQSTAQYTYTFNGWDSEIGKVTGAKDYTATYSNIVNKYLITFENFDGTELQRKEVSYGDTPVYTGATPVRPSTAQYTYTFNGWDSEIGKVTGAKDYTATYSSTVNKYVIRFLNEDGTELQSEELEYGAIPVYAGETPTKQSTAQYTYTFNGWNSEIEKVTGAKDYTATYTSTVNKYLITFENYNGDELQSSEVEYGQTPSYTGTTPIKPADAEFTYTFSGWSPEVVAVVGAQTYTAQFSSTVNKYTITLNGINCDVTGDGVYDYGTVVELLATPHDGYAFQSWSDGNTDNPRTIVVDRDYDISANMCKASFEKISATIFKGDYYEFGDRHLTQRGTYTETFLNKAGCDSVVVLTLSVIPIPTYNVRLSVYKDDTWGSVTGDGTYRKGTTATLNAVPASGYKFSYWYDQDTQERIYENPLSFVVEKAVSLTASFSRAPKIKVTYGQRSAEAEGDGEDDVISYVVSTKQHVDIDNVGSRSILIYNTAGQIMLRQVNVEHYEGHLPSGVYIINIDGVMEKFIVR